MAPTMSPTHVEQIPKKKSIMHQLPLAGLERRLNRASLWMTLDCASKTGAAGSAARSTRLVSVKVVIAGRSVLVP